MTSIIALAAPAAALAFQNPQVPLPGSSIKQFTQPLPRLSVQPGGTINTVVATDTSLQAPLQISMCEFKAQVLPPPLPATWVWGYLPVSTCPDYKVANPPLPLDTYIGPVLVNVKGTPTAIKFRNGLPTVDKTDVLAYKYSTDQTLHWADPLGGGMNTCKMAIGDPAQMDVGIAPFQSDCSLNLGEYVVDPVTNTRAFNPVGIPAVPHLHGGEVPPVLDGGPDAWFTSDGLMKGHGYYTYSDGANAVTAAGNEAIYRYPNSQGAAPLWFHDHTLGATRLNVYAGIAGGYYLLDPAQEAYFEQIKMRPVTDVIPIVLQDRQFDVNGQLYFPTGFPGGLNGPPTNPQHPYWNPEFMGDTIVVNGKAWPFVNVEPRRYRLLFLNGSNARTYELFLKDTKGAVGPPLWVIGNDGGFLDKPVIIDPKTKVRPHLDIMPGERYEVIVDFSKSAGTTFFLKNVAKTPFPGGAAPNGTTTGQLMQFRVGTNAVTDTSYDPASGIPLRPAAIVRLTNPATGTVAPGVTIAQIRQLTLNEVMLMPQTAIDPVTGISTLYPGGPYEILVNNTSWSGKDRPDFQANSLPGQAMPAFISETPAEGTTELWEIVNITADAHPIHTHLATFQILNRQAMDVGKYNAVYAAAFGQLPDVPLPAGCTAGLYCPGYGPPLDYATGNPLALGGNPDVTPALKGPIQPPDPSEAGWKDTFIVYPGMVNRILVRFAPTDTPAGVIAGYPFSPNDGTDGAVADSHGYVWHCHIIDHEDNEMMRPDVIVPLADAPRDFVKGTDY